ncbi:MAG TPA: AI-2E family transporter, partial [Thermodesulfobacteriota bacterium]|nr:AI-2E family transporter [Thermodesulfobacteriota bacterium]
MAKAASPNDIRQQEVKKLDVISPAEESKTRLEFKSTAVKGLFIIACFYTLYFTRALIMPLALAFLLNFLLRPVVRALKRIKIPELIGAAMVLIALLGIVGYGAIKLSKPAAEWMEEAPERLQKIELKVDFLRKPVERVNKAAEALKKIMTMGVEHAAE